MARFETNGGAGPAAPVGARSPQNDFLASTSFLQGANAGYLESLLAAYEADPSSVSADWRNFFAEMGVDRRRRPSPTARAGRGATGRSRTANG